MTLYAQWRIPTYTVKFNANGGSGSMSNEGFSVGTAKALTANAFTKSGYIFAGWATSAKGELLYKNKQSVKNLSTSDGATVNLYAKWYTKSNPTVIVDKHYPNVTLYEYDGYKFYYMPYTYRYSTAKELAERMNGHLIMIKNQGLNNFVHWHMFNGNDIWLGAHKVNGKFYWDDDTPIDYTNWGPGNPDNSGGVENGIEFYHETEQWNDINAGHGGDQQNFIVQI